MKPMERRVTYLEQSGPLCLSPAVKAWLGWSLTAAEQHALDAREVSTIDLGTIDTSTWSKELKAWLGVE